MLPEDRLDELLARHETGEQPWADARDDALLPLLEAASQLDVLGTVTPSAEFVASLRERLLAQAGALQAAEQNTVEGFDDPTFPIAPLPLGSDYPTLPGTWRSPEVTDDVALEYGERTHSASPPGRPTLHLHSVPRQPRRVWRIVAAAVLLLAVGGSLFATTAMAQPGSPLYSLHRWSDDARAGLDTSPSDRVRLHLSYASDALSALNAIVTQHQGSAAYRDALSTVRDEDEASALGLAAVPLGAERDSLAAQLAALQQNERQDLRAALTQVGWTDRVLTTTALGNLGQPVPVVASVRIIRSEHSGSGGHGQSGYDWLAIITGTGFQPGAACIFDGQPEGTVTAASPTQLVVQWSGLETASGAFGVQNPDGTAAQTSTIQRMTDDHGNSGNSGGSPTATPTTDDSHSGHGSDGGGSSGDG